MMSAFTCCMAGDTVILVTLNYRPDMPLENTQVHAAGAQQRVAPHDKKWHKREQFLHGGTSLPLIPFSSESLMINSLMTTLLRSYRTAIK